MENPPDVTFRMAEAKDCPDIVKLIKELAVFEKMPDEAKLTAADLERDGFGPKPCFWCILAELEGKTVGMAFYFYSYSTWKGKCLYLEDLLVTESCRNQEIGSKLLQQVAITALKTDCMRIDFEVLSWNPATKFYKRHGAVDMTAAEDWHKYRLLYDSIERLAAQNFKKS